MTASHERPLIVGLDGSSTGDAAVQWAVEEAALGGLPLLLLSGFTTPVANMSDGVPASSTWLAGDEAHGEAQRSVDLALTKIGTEYPTVDVSGRVARGNIYDEVLTSARHADMVIIGARGGFHLFHAGLLGTPLTRRSPAPVVVTPTGLAAKPDGEVVVGITRGDDAHPVLAYAFEYAQRHTAPVRVVCCLPGRRASYQGTEEWLFDALSVWQNAYPDIRLSSLVVAANPTSRLIVDSEHARLLVIGGRRRVDTQWALRRRVHRLLRWTRRPVAVVPVGPETRPTSD